MGVRTLRPIREKLARAQTAFFRAAELVAHLVVVERGVVTNVDRLTQELLRRISFGTRSKSGK